jgi:regulator of RNase E activity RraA
VDGHKTLEASVSSLSPRVLEKLGTFDTPTICNLVDLFQVRPHNSGYTDAQIKALVPGLGTTVGFAATATVRASAPPEPGSPTVSLEEQLERFHELAGPPVVVLQDLDEPPVGATFGEVMCTSYETFGAVGLVSSGAGRDLEQIRAMGFPVFAHSALCARGYFHILAAHVPVRVGGMRVQPNDLIHGDCNGVTTIPLAIAAEVADIGDELVAAEQMILDALAGGQPSLRALGRARSAAQAEIEKLRQQVSRRV